MNADEMKMAFGDEYPDAISLEGVRAPLVEERRWSRIFRNSEEKVEAFFSRFMDGSASITLEELQAGWNSWSERDRQDLCSGMSWLHEHSEFSALVRFILSQGTHSELSGIASCAAAHLPQQEAFEFFLATLARTPVGRGSNFVQALAISKHPDALQAIRDRLEVSWAHPEMWQNDPFTNWVAFEATVCIQHLLDLGVQAVDFEDRVRALAEHSCSGNRDACRRYFRRHYSWLPEADEPAGGA